MLEGVIIISEGERKVSLNNFLSIANDERRIQKAGNNFCEACDKMVSLIFSFVQEAIKKNSDIANDFTRKKFYTGDNSGATIYIHGILEKNFKDYQRLHLVTSQRDILLATIADRMEGAYLGSCDRIWHRSWQNCFDCPLIGVCISTDKKSWNKSSEK